jgi:YVTN family beta-propeller protein
LAWESAASAVEKRWTLTVDFRNFSGLKATGIPLAAKFTLLQSTRPTRWPHSNSRRVAARMKIVRLSRLLAPGLVSVFSGLGADAAGPVGAPAARGWYSPTALAASSAGDSLFIACATANQIVVFDPGQRAVVRRIAVPAAPLGLVLAPNGRTLYVTCAAPESMVCVVDTTSARITAQIPAGHTAMGPVLSPDGRTLFVCNRFNDDVAFIDLATRKTTRRVKVAREPVAAAITQDGKFLLVANHLQAGRADAEVVAATVTVIDVALGRIVKEIALPNGSGLLRDVRLSPDGKHAIIPHQVARFHLPTTQVERGWINTNAVSVIDAHALQLVSTVLLDNIDAGAANPWSAAWSADSRTFGVTHAGTHELSVVDFPALLAKLAALARAAAAGPATSAAPAPTLAEVANDLSFLVGLRRRIPAASADRGPRAVIFAGTKAYLANYFSDTLTIIDLAAPDQPAASVPLQTPPTMDVVRRGEALFNDATFCFQGWQSCASCHTSDARVDGLNWDLLNDGIGNPKNAKSLVFAHQTPPSMWRGVRADAGVAVRAGIRFSMFTVQPEETAAALDEYLQALDPIPSPHLVQGKFSSAALRGQQIFSAKSTGCAECHPPLLLTDTKPYDVGTRGPRDQPTDQFDTPTLIELWRSAPYLHDGSAVTVREVLTTRNRDGRHGKTAHLKPQELDDLVEYLLSL